ncbi:MAG: EF-hand domain-containing protein [Sphingomonas bacterium]|nr:EF-hand domain-containing protein [Sphingomonas bacterium]
MWRYLVGGVAALAMAGAGVLVFGTHGVPAPLLAARGDPGIATAQLDTPLPTSVPEALPATREQKRFDRYDKDRDGKITRDEYLAQRRKAYAKLDTNHDGRLSFGEWAVKAATKFSTADRDASGTMTATEFATTAVKRKPKARLKCPPAAKTVEEES